MTAAGPPHPPTNDTIRPITAHELDHAADLLAAAYLADPAFAELYGLRPGIELTSTRWLFHGIVRTLPPRYRTTLGCFRDGKLVGVCAHVPHAATTWRAAFARRPLRTVLAWLQFHLRQRWWKPALGRKARRRQRAYWKLAKAQAPRVPSLHVLALGVLASAQRTGVAGRLLDAVAKDHRFGPRLQQVLVETWHPAKVAIYERLGFTVQAHGAADGVECWTLCRAVR